MLNEHDPVIAELNRHLKAVEDFDDEQAAFEDWKEGKSYEEMFKIVNQDTWLESMEGIICETHNGYGKRAMEMTDDLCRQAYEIHLKKEAANAVRARVEQTQQVGSWW